MSELTSWGYSVAESLADIITETEFNTYTASRYSGDTRITPGISAASLALRNHCGWHLAGSVECEISWTAENRGVIKRGADLIIQLPARFVTEIESVTIAGTETTDFTFQTNGLLKVYDVGYLERRNVIDVVYTAGVSNTNAIKELVAQMVTLSLSKSYGVTSEAAGGVSVTYNSSWTNGSFDSVLSNNAGLLAPYRLEGVF